MFHQFGTSSSNVQLNFTYNAAHQIDGLDETTTGTSLPTGDLTPRPAAASSTGTITYNAANQALLAACTSARPCYNAAGDLIYDGTRTFTYDTEGDGRMLTATDGTTTATYLYNPFGQRIAKVVNGVVTGYALSLAGHEIGEFTNGQFTRANFFDPSDTAPVASTDASGTPTYFYPDNLGSVILTSQGTQVTNFVGYLPYGDTTTGTLAGTEFGYGGYRYDAETGLYHTATRAYDPKTGRFLQPDPIGYAGGRDLYAYAGGDPINNVDPQGTDQTEAFAEGDDVAADTLLQEAFSLSGYTFDENGSDFSSDGNLLSASDEENAAATTYGQTYAAVGGTFGAQQGQPSGASGFDASLAESASPQVQVAQAAPPLYTGSPVASDAPPLQIVSRDPGVTQDPLSLGMLLGIGLAAVGLPEEIASGLGDLTLSEVSSIQNVVNQAGRPLEVVGSAASGARTAASDIDYVVPPSSLQYYKGLEGQLPGIDPNHGIIPGVGNPNIGPVIRFEPTVP